MCVASIINAACVLWPLPASDAGVTKGDLYVSPNGSDYNPGTQAAPFATIVAASRVAQPGTTIHVAPGTYYGGFVTTPSGTASRPIHYVSDKKWHAKIIPPAGSTSGYALWDNRGALVIINGFEIDGSHNSSARWHDGIYTAGSYSVIQNNHVHNIAQNVPSTAAGAGIEADSYYGGTNIDIIGNIVHDIGPPGRSKTIQGIYPATSGKIENNLVYNCAGGGISSWHNATHNKLVNNTIVGCRSEGITVGSGDYYNGFAGPNDYNYVANNIVVGNSPVGIDEEGRTGTHNIYTNNLVWNNTTRNWGLQNGNTHTNDVTADPQFVDSAGNDYHLAAGSPAIGAGRATDAPRIDLAGIARLQAAGVDIGAYETLGHGGW
jgi:hypothetical protein